VKYGAALHMNTGQVKAAPSWAWGGEQDLIAVAEFLGITPMVHCSTHGNVHSYGSGEEKKWIYFDEVREHYEAMHKVAEELLQETEVVHDEVKQLESQRHCVPWKCCKCTYVNAGAEAGFLSCGACDSARAESQGDQTQQQAAERGSDAEEPSEPECDSDGDEMPRLEEIRPTVVCAPVVMEDQQDSVHVPLAYGRVFHISQCCPELDPGSAKIKWSEAEERAMSPCEVCTTWSDSEQQQQEQQVVMLPAGTGKCFHTNVQRCNGDIICAKK
jgi:hypothetical protein